MLDTFLAPLLLPEPPIKPHEHTSFEKTGFPVAARARPKHVTRRRIEPQMRSLEKVKLAFFYLKMGTFGHSLCLIKYLAKAGFQGPECMYVKDSMNRSYDNGPELQDPLNLEQC